MINISAMKEENLSDAVALWICQFNRHCYCNVFPNFIDGGQGTVKSYIKEQIDKGNAIIATKNNTIVGFIAWMYFDFHGERTAFLPVAGHAALLSDELNIYREMYCYASQKWVSDNRFNHLWMTYFDDDNLKNSLYDLGFGSYVIDACQLTSATGHVINQDYKIVFASAADAEALTEVANSSNEYYINSPIFLQRNKYTKDEIMQLIDKNYVLLAWDKDKIAGVLSFSINQSYNFERLTTVDSARIEGIGAYILPDYRGKGMGTALLDKAFAFCKEKGKTYMHVSYESANPNAIQFWPKYFKPAIRSVRRTINKDANTNR